MSVRSVLVAAVVALPGVAACKAHGIEPTIVDVDGGAPVATTPAPVAMRAQFLSVPIDGQERSYLVVAPEAVDCAKCLPLVFLFHGQGGSGVELRGYFEVERAAGGRGVFVYPDGLGRPELGGKTGWDLGVASADLLFFDAMLEAVASRFEVDRARVFAAGHSRGARFTNSLGCFRGRALRAIAAVSGGGPTAVCGGPVAALVMHGRFDRVNSPYEGRATLERWAGEDGCDPVPDDTQFTLDRCTRLAGCETPVEYCPNGETQWDGHFPPPFHGPAIWAFFAR
jgi:polyhydroxybutyrate depolymerase